MNINQVIKTFSEDIEKLESAFVRQQYMMDSMQKQINALSLSKITAEDCLLSTPFICELKEKDAKKI